jgi:DNA-binding beta-propeller fold protein YncE
MSRVWVFPAAVCLAAMTHSVAQQADRLKPTAGLLIIANKNDRSLGIVDPMSGKQVASVPEGGVTGHELIASPDGKTAYVPIYGDSGVGQPGSDGTNIAVIDLASRKVVGNIDFGHGVRPHCPMFGPRDGMLYVTTEIDQSVSVIDPRTLKIVGAVPTGQAESHMLILSHDGRLGYTANVGPGTVSVLDIEGRKTLGVIQVAPHVQRISISPDDSMVFTSDTTKPQLAVIDTASRKVKEWIPLPAAGYGSASTSDGRWLLIAAPRANQVAAIDLRTMKVAHTIDVPRAPQEVLIRPDDQVAYVSCDSSHQVAEIGLSDWKVNRLIEAGRGVDGLAWAPAQ